jgi:hypothetical protein
MLRSQGMPTTGAGSGGGGAPCTALTDTSSHAPPTTGTYAYNSWKPGAAGFPAVGEFYTDPVFGQKITRLSDVGTANEGDSNLYFKNGFWNADGTYHTFTNGATGTNDIINAATGAIVRSSVGFNFDSSFDPVDRDILWKLNTNGSGTLVRYSVLNNTNTTEHTFPAALESLGGTTDWISNDGDIFLLMWSGALHIWKRSTNTTYTGAPAVTIGGHWAGLTPDGKYAIAFGTGSTGIFSYAINHVAETLSTTGVMFWNVNIDDHGDLCTASDGNNYLVLYEYNVSGTVRAVDIAVDRAGQTSAQQLDSSRLLYTNPTAAQSGDVFQEYFFSCISRGSRKDWAIVATCGSDDTFDSSPTWNAFKSEIFAIHVLTANTVRRYGHHRSRSVGGGNNRLPRVDVNWDGTAAIFSSDFNIDGTAGGGDYSDLYRLEVCV